MYFIVQLENLFFVYNIYVQLDESFRSTQMTSVTYFHRIFLIFFHCIRTFSVLVSMWYVHITTYYYNADGTTIRFKFMMLFMWVLRCSLITIYLENSKDFDHNSMRIEIVCSAVFIGSLNAFYLNCFRKSQRVNNEKLNFQCWSGLFW